MVFFLGLPHPSMYIQGECPYPPFDLLTWKGYNRQSSSKDPVRVQNTVGIKRSKKVIDQVRHSTKLLGEVCLESGLQREQEQ